jgi:hypothetical protein
MSCSKAAHPGGLFLCPTDGPLRVDGGALKPNPNDAISHRKLEYNRIQHAKAAAPSG